MRFQDNLLLQKQHAEELVRQQVAQTILDEASTRIQAVYQARKKFRDPIEESRARIKALQRRAASACASGSSSSQQTAYEVYTNRKHGSTGNQQQQDNAIKEVTVRHLNDHANLNQTAFRLYRKLRFG